MKDGRISSDLQNDRDPRNKTVTQNSRQEEKI
jgi:hypothetical protein